MLVILNEVKNLVESIGWKTEILRLTPQNDITTQSPMGGGSYFLGSIEVKEELFHPIFKDGGENIEYHRIL